MLKKMSLSCLFVCILVLAGSASARGGGYEISKRACLMTSACPDKSMNEIEKLLLAKARRKALDEIYGEMGLFRAEANDSPPTYHLTSAESLSLIRIKGNPTFRNGEEPGEVCVEINAYVTGEDLKKLEPREISLKNYCLNNPTIPVKEVKDSARTSAFLEIVKIHNPSLRDISGTEAERLIHEFTLTREDFDLETGTYCMDITVTVVPFELEYYSKGGEATKTEPEEDSRNGGAKAWIGVAIQDLTHESAQYYGLNQRKGAVVLAVFREGPSGKAGIKVEDVITAVDTKKIEDSEDLAQRISRLPVGKELTLKVIRKGKERDFRVVMSERPEDS